VLGSVDIFVSNAASGVLRSATELEDRHWQWTVDINAKAFFTLVQGLVKSDGDGASTLMGSGGRIVALSSLGAVRAIPQYTAVGASKAALEALVRHFALELGPRGIGVNAVSPGIVDTGALAHFPNREQLLDVARSRTPAGRLTTADDVAGVVAFLCTPEARMIHGQTVHVDGGYSVVA
jgi:enoyl-[acyl-carrier protein] reductase III